MAAEGQGGLYTTMKTSTTMDVCHDRPLWSCTSQCTHRPPGLDEIICVRVLSLNSVKV